MTPDLRQDYGPQRHVPRDHALVFQLTLVRVPEERLGGLHPETTPVLRHTMRSAAEEEAALPSSLHPDRRSSSREEEEEETAVRTQWSGHMD